MNCFQVEEQNEQNTKHIEHYKKANESRYFEKQQELTRRRQEEHQRKMQ